MSLSLRREKRTRMKRTTKTIFTITEPVHIPGRVL